MLSHPEQQSLCPVCQKPAEQRAIEKLPSGGTVSIAIHKDGSKFCRYGDFVAKETKTKQKLEPAPIVTCPICGEKGRVESINDWVKGNPEWEKGTKIRYRVRHGAFRGPDRKVCPIHVDQQEERDDLLKQIGRYIATPPPLKKKRGRPKTKKQIQNQIIKKGREKSFLEYTGQFSVTNRTAK